MLRRFWFTFDEEISPGFLGLGCGLTARDLLDAVRMIAFEFGQEAVERIESFIVDVDVRTLEKGHVLTNLGNPAVRGIWYPCLNLNGLDPDVFWH